MPDAIKQTEFEKWWASPTGRLTGVAKDDADLAFHAGYMAALEDVLVRLNHVGTAYVEPRIGDIAGAGI